MEEMSKHGQVGKAAMMANMDRKTARKHIAAGRLPSETVEPRDWRTRKDPFEHDWDEVAQLLAATPELEAKTLFEVLSERHPERYHEGQLRTLQRHVQRWRAEHGPEREVVLGQAHRPGEAAQTDFTWATELGVTLAGQLFVHMLCVVVLPFSNWQWATVCLTESMAALRRGVQAALFQLGRVPVFHQTDNSTAATHRIPKDQAVTDGTHGRLFNEEYLALMRHLGMKPRTTEVGAKEQNGDVEASNGALKRRLIQALALRGNRDFESREKWESFVHQVLRKANAARGPRVAQEIEAMRPLVVAKLPEYVEERVRVCERSTVRVKRGAYSVPSRLRGQWLRVRLYEDHLDIYYADKLVLSVDRLRGDKRHRIDYRHVIWSLMRKPGGFARYVYREEMFPSLTFRRAYDAIALLKPGIKADVEYLRILHLAASTFESEVQTALEVLLTAGTPITSTAVKALMAKPAPIAVPELIPPVVDLHVYDGLLDGVAA